MSHLSPALGCTFTLNLQESVIILKILNMSSLQVNGINVENATHEEVVSVTLYIYVLFIRCSFILSFSLELHFPECIHRQR